MASATVKLRNDIFSPESQPAANWYIIPTRMTYSNLISVTAGAGWNSYSNVTVSPGNVYAHAWGTRVAAMQWASIPGDITFVFRDAAHNTNGQTAHVQVRVIDAWAGNATASATDIIIVSLGDTMDNNGDFWVQGYPVGVASGDAAYDCTVSVSIIDSLGTVQPGTFLLPFRDIDQRKSVYPGTGTTIEGVYLNTPGEVYSESVEITSGCSAIYAKSGQHGSTASPGSGSWLHMDSNIVDVWLSDANNISYSYNPVAGQGLRISNGLDVDASSTCTDINCLMTSGCTAILRGTSAGTSLRGEGMIYNVSYNGNPRSPITSVTNVPTTQYKIKGVNLTLSSQIPEGNVSATGTVATFVNWNTNSAGTGTSYSSGSTYTTDANVTLYAQWSIGYIINFNTTDGYGIKGSTIMGTNDNISFTVASGGSINVVDQGWRFERLGHTIAGWASTSQATSAQWSTNYTFTNVTAPATYYAVWTQKTHPVVFYDGYSDDVLETVYVKHGQNVDPNDVPVVGQVYGGREFRNPSKFYSFAGWAGSMLNIVDTTNIVARWDFTPIWVMKNGSWVKYNPTEN